MSSSLENYRNLFSLKKPYKAIKFHTGFTFGLFTPFTLAYVNEYLYLKAHLIRDIWPSSAIFKEASIKSFP